MVDAGKPEDRIAAAVEAAMDVEMNGFSMRKIAQGRDAQSGNSGSVEADAHKMVVDIAQRLSDGTRRQKDAITMVRLTLSPFGQPLSEQDKKTMQQLAEAVVNTIAQKLGIPLVLDKGGAGGVIGLN